MAREMTLTDALVPHGIRAGGLPAQAALILAGSLLVAASAQVEVPMVPVPMSLQTLAVSAVGLAYGARLAALTLIAYLAQGAIGLPVFSGGGAGLVHLFGPTSGYLFGFVAMAWATGWLAEHGLGRGVGRLTLAALIPAAGLFVPGALWLWAITPLSLSGAVAAGVTPFLLGGLVKSVLAALAVAGGWSLARKRGV